MFGLAISIAVTCLLCNAILGFKPQEQSSQCGRLEERLYFDDSFVTKPTEAPFLGTILYTKDNTTLTVECLATLIGERHMIAPAFCIQLQAQEVNPADFRIQLGAFKQTNDTKSYKCSTRGFCIPPPREYQVSGIKIHPLFDPITLAHNIAVVTLQDRVNFTPLIQPICIQAKPKLSSLIARNFQMVGVSFALKLKVKTNVFTISRRYYDNSYASLFPYVNTQFSGMQESDHTFYSGSILMGTNIRNDRPDHFYVVGILLRSAPTDESHAPLINIFQSIQPYVEWIRTQTMQLSNNELSNNENIRSQRFDAETKPDPRPPTTTTTSTTTPLPPTVQVIKSFGTRVPIAPIQRTFASASSSASSGSASASSGSASASSVYYPPSYYMPKPNSTSYVWPPPSPYRYRSKDSESNSTSHGPVSHYGPPSFMYGGKPNSTIFHRSPYHRY